MPITTEQLESESGTRIIRQHSCTGNKMPELLRICLVSFEGVESEAVWELFSIWIATQADVADEVADTVGELMNLSSITIDYCPFCGIELNDA